MIRGNVRVTIEEALSIAKNVQTAEENKHQANAENDSERHGRVLQLVNRSETINLRIYASCARRTTVLRTLRIYPSTRAFKNESL